MGEFGTIWVLSGTVAVMERLLRPLFLIAEVGGLVIDLLHPVVLALVLVVTVVVAGQDGCVRIVFAVLGCDVGTQFPVGRALVVVVGYIVKRSVARVIIQWRHGCRVSSGGDAGVHVAVACLRGSSHLQLIGRLILEG